MPRTPYTSARHLLHELRARANVPLLERLRFFDSLPVLDHTDALALAIELTDVAYEDECSATSALTSALVRLAPPSSWLALVEALEFGLDHRVDLLLGWKLVPMKLAALAAVDSATCATTLFDLRNHFYDAGAAERRLFEPHWAHIEALCGHDDLAVRCAAAELAVLGGVCSERVLAVARERLSRIVDDAPNECYDEQLGHEYFLWSIERAGPRFADLAPQVASLLVSSAPACRRAAARVLATLGDRTVLPVLKLERASRGDDDQGHTREHAVLLFARFTLGEDDALARAIEVATPNIVAMHEIGLCFERAEPSARILAGLAGLWGRGDWSAVVGSSLARFGPLAAPVVAKLRELEPGEWGRTEHLEARWRTGLIGAADVAATIEEGDGPTNFSGAWSLYLRTEAGTAPWRARIRAEIAIANPDGDVFGALIRHPHIGVAFVPDLVRAGCERVVEAIWNAVPRETFWAALES